MFPGTLHLPAGGCYPCRRMRLHLRGPAGHCSQPQCGAESGEEVPGFGALVIYRATLMVVDVGNKKCHKPTMTGDGLYMVIPPIYGGFWGEWFIVGLPH